MSGSRLRIEEIAFWASFVQTYTILHGLYAYRSGRRAPVFGGALLEQTIGTTDKEFAYNSAEKDGTD